MAAKPLLPLPTNMQGIVQVVILRIVEHCIQHLERAAGTQQRALPSVVADKDVLVAGSKLFQLFLKGKQYLTWLN